MQETEDAVQSIFDDDDDADAEYPSSDFLQAIPDEEDDARR